MTDPTPEEVHEAGDMIAEQIAAVEQQSKQRERTAEEAMSEAMTVMRAVRRRHTHEFIDARPHCTVCDTLWPCLALDTAFRLVGFASALSDSLSREVVKDEWRVAVLRAVADGRREYAESGGHDVLALQCQAEAFDAAADLIEGKATSEKLAVSFVPSWRWGAMPPDQAEYLRQLREEGNGGE